jgi:TnsA endonuclease N terminal
MSYQGKYQPSFPKKYKGDPTNIIYRSLWERKFMVYCDTNERILEWGSEEMFIWYRSPLDRKPHRYFPDFYIKVQESNGQIKKYLIEIKPQKQTTPPPKPPKQTKKYLYEAFEYAKNQAKWEAAKEWCADRGYEFKVLTEHELGIK